jgi:hypothetical protein
MRETEEKEETELNSCESQAETLEPVEAENPEPTAAEPTESPEAMYFRLLVNEHLNRILEDPEIRGVYLGIDRYGPGNDDPLKFQGVFQTRQTINGQIAADELIGLCKVLVIGLQHLQEKVWEVINAQELNLKNLQGLMLEQAEQISDEILQKATRDELISRSESAENVESQK